MDDILITIEDNPISIVIGSVPPDNKVKYNASDLLAGYLADKIKAGANISLTEGAGADADKLIITGSATPYILPVATALVLGGVKVGSRLTIDPITGVISADVQSTMSYPGAGIAVSTGAAWGSSIADNSADWNEAHGWGNHAGLYSLLAHNHSGVYAPVIHNLVDTTNHPVTGLTGGHFLKALTGTTYGFAAHGLTYSDVGAAASGHNHSGTYLPVAGAGDIYTHNASEFLTSVTAHNLLSATHGDTAAGSVVRGDVMIGNSTPKWDRLAFPGTPTGKVLIATATDVAWSASPLGTGAYATIADYLPLAGGTLTGHLFFTDNTYDIGASGATRPRTGYFGTSLISPDVYGSVLQTIPLTLSGNNATASGTNIAGGDVYIKATPGTGTGASSIHFWTGTTLTTGATLQTSSEKMTILGNGNVGIGTTSPLSRLSIEGAVASNIPLIDLTANGTQSDSWIFSAMNPNMAAGWHDYFFLGKFKSTKNSGYFSYRHSADGSDNNAISFGLYGANDLLNILANGNVGIGTTTPTALAHFKAGTATAGTAPTKWTPVGAVLNTSPEIGAWEPVADDICYTIATGTARKQVVLTDGTLLTAGRVPIAGTNGRLLDFTGLTYSDSTGLATTKNITSSGNHIFDAVAKGIIFKQGANGKCGTFTANGVTPVTVSNTSIAITDAIIISLNTVGGTVGMQPVVTTITAATGFTVVCTALDTSIYNYAIISNQA